MEGREDEDEVVVAIAVDKKVRLSKGEVHYRLERPTHMNPHLTDDEGVPVVICVHGIDHVARVWDFLAHHLVEHLGSTPLEIFKNIYISYKKKIKKIYIFYTN
jgi:hypothetical protein